GDTAVDHRRYRGQQPVLWHRPRGGISQTQCRIGRIRPRRAHRIAQQQIPGPEQRPDDEQRQRQTPGDRYDPAPQPAAFPATLRHAQPPYVSASTRWQHGGVPASRRLPVVADLTLVTAGAMTANVAGYLLQLLAGRWLGVAGYSEFASLLAVQLLCAVPALAL